MFLIMLSLSVAIQCKILTDCLQNYMLRKELNLRQSVSQQRIEGCGHIWGEESAVFQRVNTHKIFVIKIQRNKMYA